MQRIVSEKCSKIPTSTGTNVKCTNEFNARSTCQITCDPGFVNPGENVLRCLHTGRWTLDFIPQCLLVGTYSLFSKLKIK